MSRRDRSASFVHSQTDTNSKVCDRISCEEVKSHIQNIFSFLNDLDLAVWCLYKVKNYNMYIIVFINS